MYPMTITVSNEAQLNAILKAMTGFTIGEVSKPASVTSIDTAKPKAEAKKPDAAASKPSTGDTKESPASSAPAATGESSGAIDYEKTLKPAALKLAADKGRDALVAVYTKIGVSAKDAKPEQYAELLAAINEAQAA